MCKGSNKEEEEYYPEKDRVKAVSRFYQNYIVFSG